MLSADDARGVCRVAWSGAVALTGEGLQICSLRLERHRHWGRLAPQPDATVGWNGPT